MREKIYPEEQLLTKYYLMRHSKNASNPKHNGYKCGLASVVSRFFDKKSRDTTTNTGTQEQGFVMQFLGTDNEPMKHINLSIENFRNAKSIHLIQITIGSLIFQICN